MKMNCDNLVSKNRMKRVKHCFENYPDNLPNVYFFLPEQVTYFPYDPASFSKPKMLPTNKDPNELDAMIYRYMPTFAKKISNLEDFNNFIDKFDAINRTLFFSNTNEPPRYFKGLTSFFKDRLEFGYVTKDAHDVHEYLNQTSRPRWMVLKTNGVVGFEKRNYVGKRTFGDLKSYLSVFAEVTPLDRRDKDYKKSIRERMGHLGHLLQAQKFDYGDLRRNIDYEDEIVILHVTDTLSMDYPNLNILQKYAG